MQNEFWVKTCESLEKRLKTENTFNFLSWFEILTTMVHDANPAELAHLKSTNWDKWEPALRESLFGTPTPYKLHTDSSGNLIHHAYSLSKILQDANVNKFSSVFEFGGGYGSMCRLFYNLGYTGTYTILDLPVLSQLQRLYLANVSSTGWLLDTKINLLTKLETDLNVDLFIALWSISECEFLLRDDVFGKVKFKNIIITYYQDWYGNNVEYFSNLQKALPQYNWKTTEIDHLLCNYYLIGELK